MVEADPLGASAESEREEGGSYVAGLVHERLAERPDGVAAAQQDAVVQHDAVGGDVEGELEGEGGPGADAAVPEAAAGVS